VVHDIVVWELKWFIAPLPGYQAKTMASAHITIVSDSTNIFGIFEHQKCGEIGKPSIWGCI